MRRADIAAFLLLAVMISTAPQAAALSVTDVEHSVGRIGLTMSVSVIQHRREPYLLVRVQPVDLRTVIQPSGTVARVRLKHAQLVFLPVTVACERMELRNNGKTYAPDAVSLCRAPTRLANANTAPLFVVFRHPPKGTTEIVVPAAVSMPDPPVERVLDRSPYRPPPPPVDPLVGNHELVIRFQVDDPPKR